MCWPDLSGPVGLSADLALPEAKPFPPAWAVYFSVDREEVVVDLGLPGISTAGRLYFHVAADGESLELVRTQVPMPAR